MTKQKYQIGFIKGHSDKHDTNVVQGKPKEELAANLWLCSKHYTVVLNTTSRSCATS